MKTESHREVPRHQRSLRTHQDFKRIKLIEITILRNNDIPKLC